MCKRVRGTLEEYETVSISLLTLQIIAYSFCFTGTVTRVSRHSTRLSNRVTMPGVYRENTEKIQNRLSFCYFRTYFSICYINNSLLACKKDHTMRSQLLL